MLLNFICYCFFIVILGLFSVKKISIVYFIKLHIYVLLIEVDTQAKGSAMILLLSPLVVLS
jgi:hypothetical protein